MEKIDKNWVVALILVFFLAFNVQAANFRMTATLGSSTKIQDFAKVEDVINAIGLTKLVSQFPSYTGVEAVSISVDFRGLPLNLNYAASGTSLVLNIPDLGINQTFTGATRDDSNKLFKDWLKRDGQESLNAVMKKLAEVSPIDPLAGNPNSLMSQMVSNDFQQGMMAVETRSSPETEGSAGADNNLMGLGGRYQSTSDNGHETQNMTIPFSYVVKFDFNPRHQLSFYFPMSYSVVNHAKSYNISIGIGYRIPITGKWHLTPNVGTGVVGSVDLGAGGQIISGSLTSQYDFHLPANMMLTLANMVGHYRTVKLKISDLESNPKLQNMVLRNALLWSIPHPFFFWRAESELFIMDTRFTGSKLYMDQYNEVGYSLGTDKTIQGLSQFLRVGLSYLFSKKAKGYAANFGYSF